MYRITTDVPNALIEVQLEGFLSCDQVQAFADELLENVARVALTGRRQAMLYDYTNASIQSQEVVAMLQDMARSDKFGSRRVALYTNGRMARLQARRVAAAASERFAVFEDRRAALEWLSV